MPTSQNQYQQFVSHSRGQKRIDLRAALEASPDPKNTELTFGELSRAYLITHNSKPRFSRERRGFFVGARSFVQALALAASTCTVDARST